MKKILFAVIVALVYSTGISNCNNNNATTTPVRINYKSLFDTLLTAAPDSLSLDYFYKLPAFRCIHHDGFDRLSITPIDVKSNTQRSKYSYADERHLGKNSFNNSTEQAYRQLSNSSFDIGVRDNSIAFNHISGGEKDRIINYIDTGRDNYGFLFRRSDYDYSQAQVAFRVHNINNFYYVRANNKYLDVILLEKGKEHRLLRYKHHGDRFFYSLIDRDTLYLYSDYHYVESVALNRFKGANLCGIFFSGNKRCEIDDFVVNYLDTMIISPLDDYIEKGVIPKQYAGLGCELGDISCNREKTKNSRHSLKFTLRYYNDWENHKIGYSRRSELCPIAALSSALDSWICSFDVYFPGLDDGLDYYSSDSLDELFWQMHASGIINMLSPNVALYLRNNTIRFEALNRAVLRDDRISVCSNLDYDLDGIVGVLVDGTSNNYSKNEIKRGNWHNFTIYIKEGYSEAHLPRSIVYLDGKKVIDWFIPNVQNCGIHPSYLQMGIYKWPWAKTGLNLNVNSRVLYMDNIQYIR